MPSETMPSSQCMFYLLLSIIWSLEGVKRIIAANNTFAQCISRTDVITDLGGNEAPCCMIGDCVFYSLDDALYKATSNDVINITSNIATLSSKITLEGLKNISIIGHSNPTNVQCNGIGAVRFVDCDNVTIENINWIKCGLNRKSAYPGIGFYNSSEIVLYNSYFLHSTGRTLMLSNISGKIHIYNCHFTQSNKHKGHGAALYYLPSNDIRGQTMIAINNSTFKLNGAANSVVYIGGFMDNSLSRNYIRNSVFLNNQGVSIYLSHNSVHLAGSVLFKGNKADRGAGIFSSDSIITFDDECNVTFSDNLARFRGGAVYQHNSEIFHMGSSEVAFKNNSAYFTNGQGGAIYGVTSLISFNDKALVSFANNLATKDGGAIYSARLANISFAGNSKAHFTRNRAMHYGGAMRLFCGSVVSFGGNSTIILDDNSAYSGGALAGEESTVLFDGESITKFKRNIARWRGGVIYCIKNCQVMFSENSTVRFNNNRAVRDGGGVVYTRDDSNVTFNGNSFVQFTKNSARYGGSITSQVTSTISFEDFSTTIFTTNTATNGGAVSGNSNSKISFSGNSTAVFTKNKVVRYGGAISCRNNCGISFSGYSNITMSENSAIEQGGAVDTREDSQLSVKDNSLVMFSKNGAAIGGAIMTYTNSRGSFDDDSNTVFIENIATNGSALFGHSNSNISITGHSTIVFTKNEASTNGGAVCCKIHCIISISGNSHVNFSSNRAVGGSGSAIDTRDNSLLTISGNSMVTFLKNHAAGRGAVTFYTNSSVLFDDGSITTFTENTNSALIGSTDSNASFAGNSTIIFSKNIAIDKGGAVFCNIHCSILFNGSANVIFSENKAVVEGGAVDIKDDSLLSIRDNSHVTFTNNSAKSGGAVQCDSLSRMMVDENAALTFINNTATMLGGAISIAYSQMLFKGRSMVNFKQNTAMYGGAVMAHGASRVSFGEFSSATFTANMATRNGGALIGNNASNISVTGNTVIVFKQNKATNDGGGISCGYHSGVSFSGNSNVTFHENIAAGGSGGALDTLSSSYITFFKNSSVLFTKNVAKFGGAGRAFINSSMSFGGFSIAIFTENTARNGGALIGNDYSNLSFSGNTTVLFKGNTVTGDGGVMRCKDHGSVLTSGNANVTFRENNASSYGGAIDLRSSKITTSGSSLVTFVGNSAADGGAVECRFQSSVRFGESTIVRFINNNALGYGGALHTNYDSDVTFEGESTVFNNRAIHGGAICSSAMSSVRFADNSAVILANNLATLNGGALSSINSTITYSGHSSVYLQSNTAKQDGGAVHSTQRSCILFGENSSVMIENNVALQNGGAAHLFDHSIIMFDTYSMVVIHNNTASEHGGGLSFSTQAGATFQGNSIVTLKNNVANLNGGAVYASSHCFLSFKSNSEVTLSYNKCRLYGGAVHLNAKITLNISGAALVNFHGNKAVRGGGAVYSYDDSNITASNKSRVVLSGNSVTLYGGAVYCEGHSNVTLEGNVTFINNTAQQGGAVYISEGRVSFEQHSVTNFTDNAAINGGAIYLTNNFLAVFSFGSAITFVNNAANRYGGVILAELADNVNSTSMILNTTAINFHDTNSALVGKYIYMHVRILCDQRCVFTSLTVGDHVMSVYPNLFGQLVITPPSQLVLQDPAICIDYANSTKCDTYLINNVMLGQEIILDACVLDYFNQPTAATQFLISSDAQNHYIAGSDRVLISCNMLQPIKVIGSKVTSTEMFSISFVSHSESQLDLKNSFVTLKVELSPCHLGFRYDNKTQRCECFSKNDIISCIDSQSVIKKNYWYGEVDNITTVTICPNHYCNFSCCKAGDESFQLSPARMNQCLLHRSGAACGGCEEGYALSFDSITCVNINKCTIAHTVLVVSLTVIYWIVIVILVFILTYYNAGIGYLYAITYYYSMVDILLGEHLYNTQGLFTVVSIMSSTAKITPQFLGQLCFVKNLSGIDQQFIHYAHPVAVTVIVALLCLSARLSMRVSEFVSKGIIHVICFLVLLSYTSIATTSLLLLRSLTYHDVSKIYTYLSPDIEYCHGRHLPYVIIAILCTLVIVAGLPLLLLLEPFLNSKINFTRIKPLLDQFQGCYKDKYRCFAAYYMACRLVNIVIIISNSSNDSTTHYLLIIFNATLALIQVTFRPYASKLLNIFDGLILHQLIVISMLPLVDSANYDLLLPFIIILVTLPLLAFLIMVIYRNKAAVKRFTKCRAPSKPDTTNGNIEDQVPDFVDSVIDENSRRNATIVDSIKEPQTYEECTHYRESFMAVMSQIKDMKK